MSEPFEIIDPVERFVDARESVAAEFENSRQRIPNQPLWLVGAVAFAIGTVILVNAVSPRIEIASRPIQHNVSSDQTGSDPSAPMQAASPRAQPVHAIDPEAPADHHQVQPSQRPSTETSGQRTAAMEVSPLTQDQGAEAEAPSQLGLEDQLVKITSVASIRDGPSASADIIGMAYAGTVARFASRESGWTQIVDPSSGKTGWVDSTVLSPMTSTFDTGSIEGSTSKALSEAALDQDVEIPDGQALPAAKAEKHSLKRHYGRRRFPFRFAFSLFRR